MWWIEGDIKIKEGCVMGERLEFPFKFAEVIHVGL